MVLARGRVVKGAFEHAAVRLRRAAMEFDPPALAAFPLEEDRHAVVSSRGFRLIGETRPKPNRFAPFVDLAVSVHRQNHLVVLIRQLRPAQITQSLYPIAAKEHIVGKPKSPTVRLIGGMKQHLAGTIILLDEYRQTPLMARGCC